MIIIVCLLYVIFKNNNITSIYESDKTEVVGKVKDIKEEDSKYKIILKSKENLIVYYSKKIDFNLGDTIKISGSVVNPNKNTIFNLFNYRKYLLSKNIHYTFKANNIIIVNNNKNIFYKIKIWLINRINNMEKSEYLKAFVLGDNSYISNDVINSYRTNGISHLFSISGMHVSFISGMLLLVLNKIKTSNLNYILVMLFLLFFMFITNFTPSIIRAVLLFVFLFINKSLKLNLSTFKIILFILILSLFINPYNIYNIGFKFSYIVSMFLIKFNKIINNFKSYISKILVTSFISFLASLPIMINNYFGINIMTIINNLIFVPLISIIIFPLSFVTLFIPKLDFIFSFAINFLENLSLFIIKFKIFIVLPKVNILIIIIYYLGIVFVLRNILKKKYEYIIIIVIILFIHTNINNIINTTFVTFIDVGQGDSALIHDNKNNILIDTGGNVNYNISKNIIDYLYSNGIRNINYLIITHGDYDHMGESINLVNNFKVEKVIFNCGEYNDLEKELIKVLDKKKIKYYSCIKELNIDENKLYFLQTKEYDNENDNSNVIYTELNGYNFMFMGDASITTEKEILSKYNLSDIDVLKVGHHGSKTSSSKEFINKINPKYSIISVGKNNRYGHPNKEVLNNLNDSKIYRTDKDGSIMFKMKNNKLKIETCTP